MHCIMHPQARFASSCSATILGIASEFYFNAVEHLTISLVLSLAPQWQYWNFESKAEFVQLRPLNEVWLRMVTSLEPDVP